MHTGADSVVECDDQRLDLDKVADEVLIDQFLGAYIRRGLVVLALEPLSGDEQDCVIVIDDGLEVSEHDEVKRWCAIDDGKYRARQRSEGPHFLRGDRRYREPA
ncbi:hypothetical protein [Amycolatopsis sp. RTGN1]|uniref:hypothetical protein n=1 Tax=Amycolatopsis ponsaeliensis TaxID=2992142 RepID=UPI00254D4B0C|nr:hypothetical protein [Amycolatopsis sp. RTGN1]